jgi:hypothetical protein
MRATGTPGKSDRLTVAVGGDDAAWSADHDGLDRSGQREENPMRLGGAPFDRPSTTTLWSSSERILRIERIKSENR